MVKKDTESTFFVLLVARQYPPEVRYAINEMALKKATGFFVEGTEYPLEEGWLPVMGIDKRIRGPRMFGAQGNGAELVDLLPQGGFNLDELEAQLPPELQNLIQKT